MIGASAAWRSAPSHRAGRRRPSCASPSRRGGGRPAPVPPPKRSALRSRRLRSRSGSRAGPRRRATARRKRSRRCARRGPPRCCSASKLDCPRDDPHDLAVDHEALARVARAPRRSRGSGHSATGSCATRDRRPAVAEGQAAVAVELALDDPVGVVEDVAVSVAFIASGRRGIGSAMALSYTGYAHRMPRSIFNGAITSAPSWCRSSCSPPSSTRPSSSASATTRTARRSSTGASRRGPAGRSTTTASSRATSEPRPWVLLTDDEIKATRRPPRARSTSRTSSRPTRSTPSTTTAPTTSASRTSAARPTPSCTPR